MAYGRKKKDRKVTRPFRLRESYYKKLEVLCVAYNKKPQEILETGVNEYLDRLEQEYIETVKNRKIAN